MVAVTETPRRIEIGLTWRALFAGLFVGLAAHVVLGLLGVAIGLTTVGAEATGGLGIGAAIWAILVPVISWFLGAYAAAYTAGVLDRGSGVWHGLVTWCLGIVTVTVLFTLGISGLLGATFGAIGETAQALAGAGVLSQEQLQQMQQAGVPQETIDQFGAVGPEAAAVAARAAWGAFAAALLSLGAAALGGAAGTRSLETRTTRPERREAPRGPVITTPRTTSP